MQQHYEPVQYELARHEPAHYEVSRERLLQQAMSQSPTKMYQECISPSRRQVKDYLGVRQPVGDTSSVSALNLDISDQVSQSGPSEAYRYKPQRHEDLLSQIQDTIHISEVHN